MKYSRSRKSPKTISKKAKGKKVPIVSLPIEATPIEETSIEEMSETIPETKPVLHAKRIRRCARAKRVTGLNPFTGEGKEKVKIRITRVFDRPFREKERTREMSRRRDRAWKDGTAADTPSEQQIKEEHDYYMSALNRKLDALSDLDDEFSYAFNDCHLTWAIIREYIEKRTKLEKRHPEDFLKWKDYVPGRY
jgi:hypothetical protein